MTTESVCYVTLLVEAESMLARARVYRAAMQVLPEGDSRRLTYETAIRDLLERTTRYATFVRLMTAAA